MIKDYREIRKEKVLSNIRNELQEINRIKRSPEGRRAFMIKWMDDTFGKERKMKDLKR